MGDLYFGDIEDPRVYRDETILTDVRALIKASQREGPVLDYKQDVSDKDNWAEAAAAFANTFGGRIIFGVEAKADRPHRMTGFDPRDTEIKTKLASTLLSRVQPRPDFQIRVVTLDDDPTKEMAILRISEGSHPPYVYSNGNQHRVFIRVGAQKAEADYLQLSALFEKRRRPEPEASSVLADLTGPSSQLYVADPPDSNVHSRNLYRFVLAPDDDRAARRLTNGVEHQFVQCIQSMYDLPQPPLLLRRPAATYVRRGAGLAIEHRFGLTARGSLGFVTHACIKTDAGPFFMPLEFCQNLIQFLIVAALFHELSRYYGSSLLEVTLKIPEQAGLHGGALARHVGDQSLFDPPLKFIQTDECGIYARVALYPMTAERMHGHLDMVVNDLARMAGSVLSPRFSETIGPLIEDALNRLHQRTSV